MDNCFSESLDNSVDSEEEDNNNESEIQLILNDSLNNEFLLKKIEHSKYPLVKVKKFDVNEYFLKRSSFRVTKYIQSVIDSVFLSTHYSTYTNEKIDIQHLGSRKGYGVIAIDNIPANEVVSLYFGAVTFKRPRKFKNRVLEVVDGDRVYWIDAKKDEESYSAYFNDDHINPNLEIRYLKPSLSEYKYPFFVTSRKILKDEELTYRYHGNNEDYWWRNTRKKYKSLKYDLRKPKTLCSGKSLQKIFEYHVDNGISEDKSSFEIVDCNEKGKGVIAKRRFPKDSFLMFYSGQEVNESELEDDSYVYEIHINNKRKWVNAFYSKCYSRFLNDNNESPNVYVKPMKHPRNGKTYIVFLAKTDIEPGDQLEYDYGGGSRNYDWRKKPKLNEDSQISSNLEIKEAENKITKDEANSSTLEGRNKKETQGLKILPTDRKSLSTVSLDKKNSLLADGFSEGLEDIETEHASKECDESTVSETSVLDQSDLSDVSEILSNNNFDFRYKVLSNFKDTLLNLRKLQKSNELVKDVSLRTFNNFVKSTNDCSLLLSFWKDCRSLYEQYLRMQNVFIEIEQSNRVDWLPKTDSSLIKNDNFYSCLDSVETAIRERGNCEVNSLSFEQKIETLFEFVFKLIKEPTNSIGKSINSDHECANSVKELSNSVQENVNSEQKDVSLDQESSNQKGENSYQDCTYINLLDATILEENFTSIDQEGVNAGQYCTSYDQDRNFTQENITLDQDRKNLTRGTNSSQILSTINSENVNSCQDRTITDHDHTNQIQEKTISDHERVNFIHENANSVIEPAFEIQELKNSINHENLNVCLKEITVYKQTSRLSGMSMPFKVLKNSKYINKNKSNCNTYVRLKNVQQFNKCFDEVESWLKEMERDLEVENYGTDLSDVQKQLKKLAHFDAALLSYQDNIDGFRLFSQSLKESTLIELNIKTKQNILEERYSALREKSLIRKKSLENSLQIFRLLRDIEEEEAWMQQKEPFSRIASWGRDLMGVQTLIEKHQAILKDIEEREERLTAVRSAAAQNSFIDKVRTKLCRLNKNWQLLKSNCKRRTNQLDYSHQIHQFFSSATEFESCLSEKEQAPDLIRDSDSNAILRLLMNTLIGQADAIFLTSSKKDELETVNVCQDFVLTPVKENIDNMCHVSNFSSQDDILVVKRKLYLLKGRYDKLMAKS